MKTIERRLTDEQIAKLEEEAKVHGLSDIDLRPLIADLHHYKQLSEERGNALEAISSYKAGNALVHVQTLKEIATKTLKEEMK